MCVVCICMWVCGVVCSTHMCVTGWFTCMCVRGYTCGVCVCVCVSKCLSYYRLLYVATELNLILRNKDI